MGFQFETRQTQAVKAQGGNGCHSHKVLEVEKNEGRINQDRARYTHKMSSFFSFEHKQAKCSKLNTSFLLGNFIF